MKDKVQHKSKLEFQEVVRKVAEDGVVEVVDVPYSRKFSAGNFFAKARREVLQKNSPDLFSRMPTGSDFI